MMGRPRVTDREHGTLACYKNGCRRPECKQANRDYVAASRARARQQQPAIDPDLSSDDWVIVERALARQRAKERPKPVVWWQRHIAREPLTPELTVTLAEYRSSYVRPVHHVIPRRRAA